MPRTRGSAARSSTPGRVGHQTRFSRPRCPWTEGRAERLHRTWLPTGPTGAPPYISTDRRPKYSGPGWSTTNQTPALSLGNRPTPPDRHQDHDRVQLVAGWAVDVPVCATVGAGGRSMTTSWWEVEATAVIPADTAPAVACCGVSGACGARLRSVSRRWRRPGLHETVTLSPEGRSALSARSRMNGSGGSRFIPGRVETAATFSHTSPPRSAAATLRAARFRAIDAGGRAPGRGCGRRPRLGGFGVAGAVDTEDNARPPAADRWQVAVNVSGHGRMGRWRSA